jgi:spore germination cell wall hydrolase CwlJ-like protein
MVALRYIRQSAGALAVASIAFMAACGHMPSSRSDRECMARVMYFESIRSSDEGMLAVGTVVMNRLESGKYPNTVCGVVGQKNQFAPGVLTKPMQEGKSRDRAYRVASEVLAGKRHRGVGKAMFFHTAGRTYHYTNMHYVVVAGGNAFYERKPTGRAYIPRTVIAQAGPRDSIVASRWGGVRIEPDRPPRPSPPAPLPVMVAAAQPSFSLAPAPVAATPAMAPMSIEALILADAGF